jgi:NAD(P)-dependent dehydrogenase (short-subunit alcohol dehydrogenase family)
MKVAGKVVVVTGGAKGIGRALSSRFVAEGAKHVVVADLDGDAAVAVATSLGRASGVAVDVAHEAQVAKLIDDTEQKHGPIDLFCSNAGIFRGRFEGLDSSDEVWRTMIDVNVMAHVYAARALVPRMIARGGGYLLHTASAAGLLAQIGSVTYSVTKHAAVALAEWLSITYGHQGIKVSILCPQAVNTEMIRGNEAGVASVNGVIEPDEVAEATIRGLDEERSLILPHAVVAEYVRRRAEDHGRWLEGMRRLQDKILRT